MADNLVFSDFACKITLQNIFLSSEREMVIGRAFDKKHDFN